MQKGAHDPAACWSAESVPGLLAYLTVAKTVQREQAGNGQLMKEAEERQKMAMLKADRLAQDTTSLDEKVQRDLPTLARRLPDIRRQAVKCSASIPICPFNSIDLCVCTRASSLCPQKRSLQVHLQRLAKWKKRRSKASSKFSSSAAR